MRYKVGLTALAQLLVAGMLAAPATAVSQQMCEPAEEVPCIYHVAADADFTDKPRPHGAGASFTIGSPHIGTNRSWSIGQMWISSGNDLDEGAWVLELGWVRAQGAESVYDDGRVHLMLNVRSSTTGANCRVWTGTRNCGFTPADDAPFGPSDSITPSSDPQLFHIGYYDGNNSWWIQYQDHWLGWIDANVLHGGKTFDRASWYGEVGSVQSQFPCVEMGNGIFGHSPGAAVVKDMFVELKDAPGLTPVQVDRLRTDGPGGSVVWDGSLDPGRNGFSYGGPGYRCAASSGDGPVRRNALSAGSGAQGVDRVDVLE